MGGQISTTLVTLEARSIRQLRHDHACDEVKWPWVAFQTTSTVSDMSPSRTGVNLWDGLESNSSEMSDVSSSASESDSEAGNSDKKSFFEGVEKLLEVWFTNKSGEIAGCDLRKIPRCHFRKRFCAAFGPIVLKSF